MTKAVRIENADISHHKIVVEVWYAKPEGIPDVKAREFRLDHPTQLLTEYIHQTQYLVIKEVQE